LSEESEAEAAAVRLEQALERIAALAARPADAAPAGSGGAATVDAAALAGRLDTLIAQLRGALAS
jgi:hypothetical protein